MKITKGATGCVTYGIHPPESPDSPSFSQISAYPNPAKQHLSVTMEKDIKGSCTVLLLNSFGQKVFSKQCTEYRKGEILSFGFSLPAGMYLLVVEAKDEVLTSKIIIE